MTPDFAEGSFRAHRPSRFVPGLGARSLAILALDRLVRFGRALNHCPALTARRGFRAALLTEGVRAVLRKFRAAVVTLRGFRQFDLVAVMFEEGVYTLEQLVLLANLHL